VTSGLSNIALPNAAGAVSGPDGFGLLGAPWEVPTKTMNAPAKTFPTVWARQNQEPLV
jgi:hypothetical protein